MCVLYVCIVCHPSQELHATCYPVLSSIMSPGYHPYQELRAIWTTSVTKAGSGGAAGLRSGTPYALGDGSATPPVGPALALLWRARGEDTPTGAPPRPPRSLGRRRVQTVTPRAQPHTHTHTHTHTPLRLPLPQIPTVRCPLPSPRRPALTQRPTPSHAPPRLLEASTQRAAHCVLAVYRSLFTLG